MLELVYDECITNQNGRNKLFARNRLERTSPDTIALTIAARVPAADKSRG